MDVIIGKPKGQQRKRQSSWVSLQLRLLHPSCHHHQRSWTLSLFFSSPPMTINNPTFLLRKDLLFSLVLLVQNIPQNHWRAHTFPWTLFSSFICVIFFIRWSLWLQHPISVYPLNCPSNPPSLHPSPFVMCDLFFLAKSYPPFKLWFLRQDLKWSFLFPPAVPAQINCFLFYKSPVFYILLNLFKTFLLLQLCMKCLSCLMSCLSLGDPLYLAEYLCVI